VRDSGWGSLGCCWWLVLRAGIKAESARLLDWLWPLGKAVACPSTGLLLVGPDALVHNGFSRPCNTR
jgi:hypothetical protein